LSGTGTLLKSCRARRDPQRTIGEERGYADPALDPYLVYYLARSGFLVTCKQLSGVQFRDIRKTGKKRRLSYNIRLLKELAAYIAHTALAHCHHVHVQAMHSRFYVRIDSSMPTFTTVPKLVFC
jgi:hypothetical protein